jgi:hypothetical protein
MRSLEIGVSLLLSLQLIPSADEQVSSGQGLWHFPIQNLTSENYESIFGHLVGFLGRGISPS